MTSKRKREKRESKAWWKGFGLASLFAIIIFRESIAMTLGKVLAALFLYS